MQVTLSEEDRQAIIKGVVKSLNRKQTKPYLTKSGVCNYLGMSQSTLSTLLDKHPVPHVDGGGKKWFKKSDIDQWFDELKR